jgi:hypothetical protein
VWAGTKDVVGREEREKIHPIRVAALALYFDNRDGMFYVFY